MSAQFQLDHTVINVRYQMDDAQDRFADLGFNLTERGYHSLGSINHLMMFGSDYLELIGLPVAAQADGGGGRPDIATAPLGINGLVFKTTDVAETHAHLQAVGMAGDAPKSFSRPVDLPAGTQDARFSTEHVRGDVFAGGRVYFCQHHTPDVVWRPEWQSHGNGASAIPEFIVVAQDAAAEADKFAKLLRTDVVTSDAARAIAFIGGQITVLTVAAYNTRYGGLASSMGDRAAIFGALVFRTGNLDAVREVMTGRDGGPAIIDDGARVVIREPAFDSVLEFIA